MSSLFVAEEQDAPQIEVKLEPGLTNELDKIEVKKEVTEETGDTKSSNKPDVQDKNEDIEMKYYNDEESDSDEEDLDDPIIDTIPVHLNANFSEKSLAPLLLQFPTKSRYSHLTENNINGLNKLKIKPESGVVELRLPLNTNNFFSETVSEKYSIQEQILRGVIIHDEPVGKECDGTIHSVSIIEKNNSKDQDNDKIKKEKKITASQFISSNSNNNSLSSIRTQPGSVGGSRYLIGVQDKEGQLHLTPLSDTCMLRPHFTYIDQAKMSKLERERELQRENNNENSNNNNTNSNNNNNSNSDDNQRKKNVSVVTMSAKSTKENIPRLGGALLSAKIENEEEGREFNVLPSDEEFIKSHFIETSGDVLNSKLSQQEYLDLLLNQTKL